MLTEVKMAVTPRLSKAVQEIVFANGGECYDNGKKEVQNINEKYLYIYKDNVLVFDNNIKLFSSDYSKEIDPYAFIASNGELEWLPLIGEKAEFSDDNENWRKDVFVGYKHNSCYKYKTKYNTYKYCRPLKKQLSFKGFLEDNGVDWELFLENCEVENQRWRSISSFYEWINDLKQEKPMFWVGNAFNWILALQKNINWKKLSDKWCKLCNQNSNIVWE